MGSMETRVFALASQITPDILDYIFRFTRSNNCNFAKIFSPMQTEDDSDYNNFRQVVNDSHKELISMISRMYDSSMHPVPFMAAATYVHDGLNANFVYNHYKKVNNDVVSNGVVESNQSILESLKNHDLNIFRGGMVTDFTNISILLGNEFKKRGKRFMDYFLEGNGHFLTESLHSLYLTKNAQSIDSLFTGMKKQFINGQMHFRATGNYNPVKVRELRMDLANFLFSNNPDAGIGKYLSNREADEFTLFDSIGPFIPRLCNEHFQNHKQMKIATIETDDLLDKACNRKKSVLIYGSPIFENSNIVLRVHDRFRSELYPKLISGGNVYFPNIKERGQLEEYAFKPSLKRFSEQQGLAMINLKDGMAICMEVKDNDFTGDNYIYNPRGLSLESYVNGKTLSRNRRRDQFIPIDIDPYEMKINAIGDGM